MPAVVPPTGQSLARLTGQAYPSHGCACSALQRPVRLDADERGVANTDTPPRRKPKPAA
jgi:hypothetical protein